MSPVLPHGSPLTWGPLCARFAVHEMFPGRRAFIPSNPVERETVPCYAASERQAEMSLTSDLAGQQPVPGWPVRVSLRQERRGNINGAVARMRY